MTPALIAVAIQEIPNLIDLLKTAFKKRNPDAPQPTSEEVLAALETAYLVSKDIDLRWLSEHAEHD